MAEAALEEAARNAIGDLYDFTVTDTTNTYRFVACRSVEATEVERVLREAGLDVAGFTHIVDTSAIRHIVNQHGGPKERLRGQVPITRDDLLWLPEIVGEPDRIENGGKTRQGRDVIRYRKRVNEDEFVYVVEVRTKWSRLAAVTLHKTRTAEKQERAGSPTPNAPS